MPRTPRGTRFRQYLFRVLVLHGPASLCDKPLDGCNIHLFSLARFSNSDTDLRLHLVISVGFRPSQRLCRFFVMMLTHAKSDGGKVEVPPSFFFLLTSASQHD
jgi:hypothetical protein